MKILISGCCGFLGSCFIDWIIERHHDVEIVGIDNLSTGFQENLDPRVMFHEIDLVDHEAVNKIFEQHSFDYICHFAAFAAEAMADFVRRHTYTQNVIASTNLINNAINHGVKRFLFTSSIASYGDLQPPFTEDMIQVPMDVYGLSKYITEQDLRIAKEHHGLEYVIVRPYNVFGPKQALNSRYRNLAGIFMNKLLDDQPLTIFGNGLQSRAFSYIDDVLPAFWNALTFEKAANETYNIGASKVYSVNEFTDILMKVTGKGQIEHLEGRHEVQVAFSDVTKAKEQLGFEEQTDLESGLKHMWTWAQSSKRHPVEDFKDVEIEKKLYSFWK